MMRYRRRMHAVRWRMDRGCVLKSVETTVFGYEKFESVMVDLLIFLYSSRVMAFNIQ